MRIYFLPALAAIMAVAGCATSQRGQSASKQPVVLSIGNQPVYADEFAYVYAKNNANAEDAYTRKGINDYLELYKNFRLKVTEAQARGLDTTTAFKKELEGYREQLAQPYLTEKSVTEQLVREAYDRMQKEINASHILITVSPEADPKDTLAAYTKIAALRQRAVAGEDFGKLARENSQDPSAKENDGNLGYFTALQMVYPFEDVAYATPVGQISKPVRTRFGYHIIKVNNERPAKGEIKVAHIMVRATPGQPKEDSLAAKKRIDEIYTLLKKGENWDKLVSQFSEDAGSAANNGELPWFGTGRMIPAFEEAAFAIPTVGNYTAPIKTPYGWHIIKLIDRKTLPAFAEVETSLRNKVAKDSRSELNKAAFVKRVKTENNFTEFQPVVKLALSKADSSLVKGNWTYDATDKKLQAPLFKLAETMYKTTDFFAYVKTNQKPRKTGSPQAIMRTMYDKFVEETVTNHEKAQLENNFIDYRMLVKEYRDGILLFQLMDEKVWSKAIQDTAGLREFFNQNRNNYQWGTRAEATIITAASPNLLDQALTQYRKGTFTYRAEKLPQGLTFEPTKTVILASATAELDKLAQLMRNDTTMQLTIIGSADSKETSGSKTNIALERAKAAEKYLVSKGLKPNRITVKAAPASKAAKTETESQRKKKRSLSFEATSQQATVLEDNLNQSNPLNVKIMPARKYQKGENKLLDGITWKQGTERFEKDGRQVYINITKVEPPMPKTLQEARGLATSDYQVYLEKRWLDELRQKYPITVNETELSKLVKK